MDNKIDAIAFGRNLPISTKQAVEVCNFIRGKNIQKAKTILGEVIKMKTAVPFRRFNKDMGHKRGRIAAGRYPIKTSQHILGIINSAEINAQAKGMNSQNLFIKLIEANRGTGTQRYGRRRGISAKRTHIEVTLFEKEQKKKAEKKQPREIKEKQEEVKKTEDVKKVEEVKKTEEVKKHD